MFEERISGFVTGNKNNQAGVLSQSFGDVLYEQIVQFPSELDYGQITSDKELSSQLWNAYRNQTRTLSTYYIQGEGVIEINLTLPKTFQPMEFVEFKATAISAQSLTLSGKIVYDFTEESIDPYQELFGNSLFVFKPHWDFERINSENFQYYTSIHKAYDGTEHRIQMVDNPRFNISANYLLMADERRDFEGFIYEKLGDEMGMPLFSELTFTDQMASSGATEIFCDTTGTILQAGQLAFLIDGNTEEIIEISEVFDNRVVLQNPIKNNYPAETYITPVIKGYVPDGINIDRLTNDISSMTFVFRAKDNESLHINNFDNPDLPEHKTLPVFNIVPERAGHRNVFENDYERVEYAYGPRYINKKWEKAENIFSYSYLNLIKDEQIKIKSLLNYSKGRLNEFWLPTWVRDMEIKETITSTETQLKVYYNNLVNSYQESGYNIRIRLYDGREFYREILSFQNSQNSNEEIVVIESSLNEVIQPEDIEIIDFIEKVRFDTDVFNLNFFSNEVSQIALTMRSSV